MNAKTINFKFRSYFSIITISILTLIINALN